MKINCYLVLEIVKISMWLVHTDYLPINTLIPRSPPVLSYDTEQRYRIAAVDSTTATVATGNWTHIIEHNEQNNQQKNKLGGLQTLIRFERNAKMKPASTRAMTVHNATCVLNTVVCPPTDPSMFSWKYFTAYGRNTGDNMSARISWNSLKQKQGGAFFLTAA